MLRATLRKGIYDYHFGQPSLKRGLPNKVMINYQLFPQPKSQAQLEEEAKLQEANKALQTQVESSTLSNGVRVVTHNCQSPHSVIGFYVQAGSKYDPSTTPGLSYVMRQAILTSNLENSLFQIDRMMRAHGISYSHNEVQKKYLTWKLEGREDMWRNAFNTLASCFVVPRFAESDIERFRDTMDNVNQELRFQAPRCYAVNELEQVAFYKEPLGSPRLVSSAICNDRCTSAELLKQYCKLFTPQHVTLAGVNVAHDELVALYEQLPYKHSAEAIHYLRASQEDTINNNNNKENTVITAPRNDLQDHTHHPSGGNSTIKTKYDDKDERAQFYDGMHNVVYEDRASAMGTLPDMESEVIVAVGVPTFGAETHAAQYATALVLREVYDHALSANLPHRAANSLYFQGACSSSNCSHSNLASMLSSGCDEEASCGNVNPFNYHGASSFYRPYASTGLIGFTLRTSASHVEEELLNVTRSFPHSRISEKMLAHAQRKALIRFVHSSTEIARDYCDFIALSRYSLESMMSAIQEVTCENVEEALQTMLEVKPALYATGSVFTLPQLTRLNKMEEDY